MNARHTFIFWITPIALLMLTACGGGGGGDGGGSAGSPGTIQLSGAVFDGAEGTSVNILVTRSGGSAGVASVDYTVADGTAVEGSDYTVTGGLSGTLTYPDQQSGNQTISIRIVDDNTAEGPESFTVTLSNASGATLGANASATVNIIDNETAVLSAFGVITALNSATVNGIRYDTNTAAVTINGQPGNVSDLKVGQVVALAGAANLSDGTGTANEIFYSATVIGPVENIDASSKRLIVMGQTVLTDEDTVFDPGIDPDSYAGLTLGATVQISGFFNDVGELMATRVDPDTTTADVRLVGVVTGLDLGNMMFAINRLTVDYGSATLIELPEGMPTEGLLVYVHGSLTDGILVVDEIGSIGNLASTPGERVHLAGIVTRFRSSADFDLNGFPMTTDANTRFVNGTISDLQANAEITVDGDVATGGNTVLANLVTFGEPVINRTARTFDFEDFTNISVFGLARVTVTQATDFSIQVTAAAPFIDRVEVTRSGDTVTLGSDGTQSFNARVTVPVLNQIDVADGSIANVTLRDFEQPQMTVNVDGVSSLYGSGLQIADVTAAVSGVSYLDFGGIRPIGNANVSIDGVSQATLNMQDGSTLAGSVRTGQGTGESRLYYFGTNVTENVTTDSVSRVIRLGDTKP